MIICKCGYCGKRKRIPNSKGYIYKTDNKIFCNIDCQKEYLSDKEKRNRIIKHSYER